MSWERRTSDRIDSEAIRNLLMVAWLAVVAGCGVLDDGQGGTAELTRRTAISFEVENGTSRQIPGHRDCTVDVELEAVVGQWLDDMPPAREWTANAKVACQQNGKLQVVRDMGPLEKDEELADLLKFEGISFSLFSQFAKFTVLSEPTVPGSQGALHPFEDGEWFVLEGHFPYDEGLYCEVVLRSGADVGALMCGEIVDAKRDTTVDNLLAEGLWVRFDRGQQKLSLDKLVDLTVEWSENNAAFRVVDADPFEWPVPGF